MVNFDKAFQRGGRNLKFRRGSASGNNGDLAVRGGVGVWGYSEEGTVAPGTGLLVLAATSLKWWVVGACNPRQLALTC